MKNQKKIFFYVIGFVVVFTIFILLSLFLSGNKNENDKDVDATIPVSDATETTKQIVEESKENNVDFQTIGDWKLIWNDEFDGTGDNLDANSLDLNKWAYQEGTGSEYGLTDWGNEELEYYQKDNVQVRDGNLVITAKKESVGGKEYTSGRLWTQPTFSATYGRFEASIKLPRGTGLWPAFWLMANTTTYGTWAANGEIDILECRGRVYNSVEGNLHYGEEWPGNLHTGGTYSFPKGSYIDDDFHTYTLEWEPGEIRWYVDGNLFLTQNDWYSKSENEATQYSFPAPFDKPFYIILNMAVGGLFDGKRMPDDEKIPAEMLIDYVRVYQKDSYIIHEKPEMEKAPLPTDAKLPVDGNYVHDTEFNNFVTESVKADGWFLSLGANSSGGEAKVEQVTIGGIKGALIDIEKTGGGSQDYSVQLMQTIPLSKGRFYKISFDAKSEGARNIHTKVSNGGLHGAWGDYTTVFNSRLSEELEHFEYIFQMKSDTHNDARLEFNVGIEDKDVYLFNVKVEEVNSLINLSGRKTPLPNGNYIYNGTFDQTDSTRMTFWEVETLKDGICEALVNDDRQLVLNSKGTSIEDVKIIQRGLNLTSTDEYKLTFDASVSEDKEIEIAFYNKDLTKKLVSKKQTITSSMTNYTIDLVMPKQNEEDGILAFLIGDNKTFILDNVLMHRMTDNNTDLSKKKTKPLKNGNFIEGIDVSWNNLAIEGGEATFEQTKEKDGIKVNITQKGANPWCVMLSQDIEMSGNLDYVLSFDVSSSVDRFFDITLEDAYYTRHFEMPNLLATNEITHYEYKVRLPQDTALAIKFLIGGVKDTPDTSHEVVIKNVKLEYVDR